MNSLPAANTAHHPASQAAALAQACNALWLATLSLMTAFMQTSAPAHRLMLARRIARNFATLRDEHIFSHDTRESFARMTVRWEKRVSLLSPEGERVEQPTGWLRRLLPR